MITLIDTQQSNISSVANMLKRIGVAARIAQSPADVLGASKVILPGVGHFATVMAWLNQSGYRAALDTAVLGQKTPILGICLGMQLMAKHSEEGDCDGLGWIDATVREFRDVAPLPVPHMGWDEVAFAPASPFANGYAEQVPPPGGGRLGGGLIGTADNIPGSTLESPPPQPSPSGGGSEPPRFYFVHSYYVTCAEKSDVLGTTHYGHDFVSAFARGNVVGAQFHPEKSHAFGMRFLKAFAEEFHG
ncbi:MAG: imidazole glycerol phosphate synthase subunit HisH [Rickettsiales bacterium]